MFGRVKKESGFAFRLELVGQPLDILVMGRLTLKPISPTKHTYPHIKLQLYATDLQTVPLVDPIQSSANWTSFVVCDFSVYWRWRHRCSYCEKDKGCISLSQGELHCHWMMFRLEVNSRHTELNVIWSQHRRVFGMQGDPLDSIVLKQHIKQKEGETFEFLPETILKVKPQSRKWKRQEKKTQRQVRRPA